MSGHSITVHPTIDDTVLNLHEADTVIDWRTKEPTTRQIVALRVGDHCTVQFNTPDKALAWLEHCKASITTEVDRKRIAATMEPLELAVPA